MSPLQWSLYNPPPFVLRKFCWIREGAEVENLIYCCKVIEEDILVTENRAGL